MRPGGSARRRRAGDVTKLLREAHRPDGTTELTLDLNGIRVAVLSVPTVIRHELGAELLDNFALRLAEASHVAREDLSGPLDPT